VSSHPTAHSAGHPAAAAARPPAAAAADYIALANSRHTLALSGVPVFTAANRQSAYRFVTLVDVLYEHRCGVGEAVWCGVRGVPGAAAVMWGVAVGVAASPLGAWEYLTNQWRIPPPLPFHLQGAPAGVG
jgi:hypothetical protein